MEKIFRKLWVFLLRGGMALFVVNIYISFHDNSMYIEKMDVSNLLKNKKV